MAALLARPTDSTEGRRVHWQAQALRAESDCRLRHSEGLMLRARVLAEAAREEPEHIAQLHRLATMSAACKLLAIAGNNRGP